MARKAGPRPKGRSVQANGPGKEPDDLQDSMTFRSSIAQTLSANRARIAVAMIIVFSLIQTVWMMRTATSADLGNIGEDRNSVYDRKFDGIQQDLPLRGIVGYITDSNDTGRFYFTQYALAPIVVDTSTEHEYVVGNFHYGIPDPQLFWDRRLYPVKDYGNGIVLLAGDAS